MVTTYSLLACCQNMPPCFLKSSVCVSLAACAAEGERASARNVYGKLTTGVSVKVDDCCAP